MNSIPPTLLNAISMISKTLNPELADNLLANFNTYDKEELAQMLDGFNVIIERGIMVSDTGGLDIDYILRYHSKDIEDLINKNKVPVII